MPVYRSLPLVISGTSLVISSSQVRFADGTAGAPSIGFGADPDTGIYRHSADSLAAATGGAERVRITSVGNVGVGTGAGTPGFRGTFIQNNYSQLNFGSVNAQGGFLTSTASSQANIAGGGAWNGSAWLATSTSASSIDQSGGVISFSNATGLTSGNTFSFTERMRIESTGDLVFNQTNSLLRLSADGSTTSATLRLAAGTSYSAAQGALILLNTVTANGSLRMLPGNGSTPAVIFANRSDLEVWRVNGNITSGDLISDATNGGNLVFNRAGKGVRVKEGSNALMGVATLVAGTVTVSTTAVTATSRIMLTGQDSSGTAGELTVSARVAGTSFTITSTSGTDTRTVAWIIFEPS